MTKQHTYKTTTTWTGNKGTGTGSYHDYDRNFVIAAEDKFKIDGSADPAFLGDKERYNPEELLLSSVASCHMLWYLHVCAEAGIVVTNYEDHATGIMQESADGSGQFIEIVLQPVVAVTEETMVTIANQLHKKANEMCFIARSVNFPVKHVPTCVVIK